MPGQREVRVAILGDARDFGRAVDAADRDMGRLDDGFGRIAGGAGRMAGAVAIGAAGVAVAGGAMALTLVHAAEESQQVTRQTEAVIQSMGASAWASADAIAALSTQLSNKTGVDDEVIQSGQNVLLTFGAVQNRVGEGNDIFDRATEAALNMSVALGTDMSTASMQVGRALNDPIRGLTALRRSGIQFTAQQEDQIRAMVAAGDAAGAQRVMLGELEHQFGGSAEAQATASQKMSVMWGNLQEQLGEKLLPVFEKVTAWLGEHLPGIIDTAMQWMDSFGAGISNVVEFVSTNWPRIQEAIGGALDWIQPKVEAFIGFVTGAWQTFGDDITRFVVQAWENIRQVIAGALELIQGVVNVVMAIIHGDWSQAWDGIKEIVHGAFNIISGVVQAAVNLLRTIIGAGLEIIGGLFHNTWDGIVNFVTSLPGRISSAASGMWDGIKDAFRAALNFIIDGWNRLEFQIPGFSVGPVHFGGFTLGLPDLPRFHTGGIVGGPPGSEQLIIARAGEEVLTEADRKRRGRATPSAPTQIVFNGPINGDVRSIAREVVAEAKWQWRVAG